MTDTIKVKLIGGPRNGDVVEIERHSLGISIPDQRPLSAVTPRSDEAPPIAATMTMVTYTRRSVRGPSFDKPFSEIVYFAPADMSDEASLRLVLAP